MSSVAEQKKQEAVAKRRPSVAMGERGLALDNLDSAIRFAEGLIHGGMVPKGVTSPGAVVGLIEAGKELGLAPMYALSNLTFTNGRLGIMGDAAKALIRGSGVLEPGTDFEESYSGEPLTPDWTCTVKAHRAGQPKPFASSFRFETAMKAKLVRVFNGQAQSATRDGWGDRGPWATYTERMMMYRALGFLVRDRFSDIIGGATITEELRDYPAERDAAPPAEPDPLLAEVQDIKIVGPSDDGNRDAQDALPSRPISHDGAAASAESAATPPPDEAALVKAIEKLEGDIVTSTSLGDLKKTWMVAQWFVSSLPDGERARLTKLYQQNESGFAAPTK